jgi:HD superfamily phosphohydrolase
MHIASQTAQALEEKGIFDADDIANIRIAALLHDIGHGPFSHLFEEVVQRKRKSSHELLGRDLILKTDIGDLISESGFNKKFITSLAFGDSKLQFMNEIISGALSADIMDYLLRDGYFTGAEHAKIDHKRITQSLDVYKKKLALEKSALYSFESMMHSRYQMFKAVYFHKTVRSAEVMLLESIRLAYDELGLSSMSLDNYIELTDDYLLARLVSLPTHTPELKRAQKFAKDYQNRELFKCVFERIFTKKDQFSNSKTSQIKNAISKKSKIDENEIFVDSSVTPSIPLSPSKKESKFLILISRHNNKISAKEIPISQLPLVSTMSGFMNILRVYTLRKNRKKVEIAAKTILGG